VARFGAVKTVGWALAAVSGTTLVVCVALIVVRVGPPLAQGLTAPTYSTPMDRSVTLSRGDWVVFQHTGTQSGAGGVTFTQQVSVTISPGDVEVTDPDGHELNLSTESTSETINRNGAIYTAAVSFDAPRGGQYRVRIAQGGDQVLLSRDLGDLFGSVIGYFVAGGGAVYLLMVAVVVLVIDGDRRRRRRTRSIARPGWYPNPNQPGTVLWWDGQRWQLPAGDIRSAR
jgi:hypothetical protein